MSENEVEYKAIAEKLLNLSVSQAETYKRLCEIVAICLENYAKNKNRIILDCLADVVKRQIDAANVTIEETKDAGVFRARNTVYE